MFVFDTIGVGMINKWVTHQCGSDNLKLCKFWLNDYAWLYNFQSKSLQFIEYVDFYYQGKDTFLDKNTFEALKATGIMCLFLNATVNPVIYGVTNPKYREAFKRLSIFARKKTISAEKPSVPQSVRGTIA